LVYGHIVTIIRGAVNCEQENEGRGEQERETLNGQSRQGAAENDERINRGGAEDAETKEGEGRKTWAMAP